jgi:DNA-binding MarR family transcriptional regulator
MAMNTYETVLFDVFLANQRRQQLISAALADSDLPAEDYPLYVFVGAEGPWTPTGLAERLEMPLTTVLFRLRRLERRGHAERVPNPEDGRSFMIRLTPEGKKLLRRARPRFRAYAEAVEERLGKKRVTELRRHLIALGRAIDEETDAPDGIRTRATALKGL